MSNSARRFTAGPSPTIAPVSFNAVSVAALAAGAILWVVALVGVIRGRGMNRAQRVLTAVVLAAAVVGVVVLIH